jgi:hypothetical protein
MDYDQPNPFLRRKVVGGASIGRAVPASGSALAQSSAPVAEVRALEDPTSKYPRPPFKSQSQPWPGLASRMTPKPDHGEQSYRGSGRLAGRRALITGGDSGMGRAARIAFGREDADVAINYLPEEKPVGRHYAFGSPSSQCRNEALCTWPGLPSSVVAERDCLIAAPESVGKSGQDDFESL